MAKEAEKQDLFFAVVIAISLTFFLSFSLTGQAVITENDIRLIYRCYDPGTGLRLATADPGKDCTGKIEAGGNGYFKETTIGYLLIGYRRGTRGIYECYGSLDKKYNCPFTGKLGDVMQESAQAAMSYVRSRALQFDLDKDFYQKVDIHIHVPEGAIPKDGPSAGITMATSIVSALLRIPVKKEVAMTGEITLRGKVLPIGGLKEKLLAAHRGQIKTVVIPKENEKDLKEVPPKIKNALKIFCAEHLDDVLKHALNLPNPERIFRKKDINLVMEEIYLKKEIPPVKAKEEEIIAHH